MSRAVEGTVAWLRSLPPDERLLKIEALRQVYPAKFLYEVAARARGEVERAIREACSMSRIHATRTRGEPYREPKMVRSRYGSRVGNNPGVLETRRWTPPHAVSLEDRYDRMDAIEAAACTDPPSISGIQFQQLEMRNGREMSRRKPRRKGTKKARPDGLSRPDA